MAYITREKLLEKMREDSERFGMEQARRLAVLTLYESGYSLREIGRALDMSHVWVRSCLLTLP